MLWLALGGLAAVLVVAGVHFGPRLVYSWFGNLVISPESGGPNSSQKQAIRQVTHGLKARIAWSSSRSGNHELYLMDLPSLKIRQLTDNDYVDFFPRFSPDGKRLVFCRSTDKWVSERDGDRWDVWLLDLESGRQERVTGHATTPRWVDGHTISFLRGRQVTLGDLATGKETVILDGGSPEVDSRLFTPQLHPTNPNLLAVTGRGKRNGVFVVQLVAGYFQRFGDGCEMGWFPDGEHVLWIDTHGKGKTRAVYSGLDKPQPKELIDLAGEFGHEYFLSLDRSGKWLVWGASAGGHEHDVADYELFLWKVGEPASQAVRLTYNAANDRWPDIYVLP